MKQATLNQAAGIASILEKINNIAQTLPEDGPAPWYICTVGNGAIEFNGSPETAPTIARPFGTDGWTRHSDVFANHFSYHKTLLNGITVRIRNAEPKPAQATDKSPVDPAVFGPEVTVPAMTESKSTPLDTIP